LLLLVVVVVVGEGCAWGGLGEVRAESARIAECMVWYCSASLDTIVERASLDELAPLRMMASGADTELESSLVGFVGSPGQRGQC